MHIVWAVEIMFLFALFFAKNTYTDAKIADATQSGRTFQSVCQRQTVPRTAKITDKIIWSVCFIERR